MALALKKGTKGAYKAIVNPTKGTILDVIEAISLKAFELAKENKEKNIIKIFQECQKKGQKALDETKEKLPALKKAGVVDAGGLGFLKIFEAWLETLKGQVFIEQEKFQTSLETESNKSEKLSSQYEIIFRIKKDKKLDLEKLKKEISQVGESIDFLETDNEVKFHIHSNTPQEIKEKIKNFEIIEWKQEDIVIEKPKTKDKKPFGLVVGESSDLPREFLEKNNITEVPFSVRLPDGQVIKKEEVFPKIKEAIEKKKPLPITSAPSFKDYLNCYQKALQEFEEILVITISSKLSGAYSSARIARSMLEDKKRVTVFDSYCAETGEGLVIWEIQELISQGKNKNEILEYLTEFCPKVKLIGALEDLSFLARSGRFYLPKKIAKLISFLSKIGIWCLFFIKEGKVRFYGIRIGKDLVKILIDELEKFSKQKPIKVAIAYGENLKEALKLKQKLEEKNNVKVLFLSQVSAVVAVHTGPKVLIVSFA